ncbi:MAG: phosphate ABC transporter permease subunit PstC [Solirubrobacterales bacterium]|nr:phosphate ABC transporter permease subunit PstC [Solirubrobacterales bacterium]
MRRRALNRTDRRVNIALRVLCLGAGLLLFVALAAIVEQVIVGAGPAINRFGLGFLTRSSDWNPPAQGATTAESYGAPLYMYGTVVTSLLSLIFSTVLGVSIGLFLAIVAPRRVTLGGRWRVSPAGLIGPLVELLAAMPSVVLGLIGVLVILPFFHSTVDPVIHAVLGWIPIFAKTYTAGNSLFAASAVLTIMIVPIIAALSRDLFSAVPQELRDGAEALGATRWEMIRGVVLPVTRSGVTAACMLGLGRAVGEAIAVEQVVGGQNQGVIHASLFLGGNTLASMIAANDPATPVTKLEGASLYYLALILLVFVVVTILAARWIAGDFKAKFR